MKKSKYTDQQIAFALRQVGNRRVPGFRNFGFDHIVKWNSAPLLEKKRAASVQGSWGTAPLFKDLSLPTYVRTHRKML